MSENRLCIAIPSSIVSDTPHLREKTSKIGVIGRAAAIFRVDEIIVFPEGPRQSNDADTHLISTLLAYMETPQYLRKKLFRLEPGLQYAGILPPLRTPHHPLNSQARKLKVGEFREGVTCYREGEKTLVDIGVEHPATIQDAVLAIGKRVTVRVTRIGMPVEVELVDRTEPRLYWGYKVVVEKHPFGSFLKKRQFDLTVATSRYGSPLASVAEQLMKRWKEARKVLVAFGSPSQGLHEIVAREGLQLSKLVDYVVNTIPGQGTETVRTEEAIISSLAAFNVTLSLGNE